MKGRNKRGALLLLSLTAAVAMLAMTSAAASATPTNVPMWSTGGAIIPFGSSSEVSGESIRDLDLQFTTGGGMQVWVSCAHLSATGKVENHAANLPGTVVGKSSSAEGPSGTWKGCYLSRYGEKVIGSGLECTIPSELPMKSEVGTLTNAGNPAGGLETTVYVQEATVKCPGGYQFTWSFALTGVGKEIEGSPGNESFETTNIVPSYGSGKGVARYGIGLSSSKGAATIAERAYEEPISTYGSHWYLGGAERTVSEGPKSLITQGSPVSLSGGFATLNLESVQSGVKVAFSCSGGTTTGSVENPSGGASGVGSVKLELTGCTVPKPEGKGCKVVGSAITTKSLPARLKPGSETNPIVELNQSLSDEIATFTVSGCSVTALNHVYTVNGRLFVKPQMRAAAKIGSWLLPTSLNEGGTFTVFGQKATAAGEITAESGGKVVTMG